MAIATARSGYESRLVGVSAGEVGALVGSRLALLLSAQGDAGQVIAVASEDGLKMGLTVTAAKVGRAAGAGSMVAEAGPRY